MKRIAIIPARGGSKRIPNKNIRDFFGKPIIAYSIEAAIHSQLYEEVMVSTDSEDIKEIALQYGAQVPFMRSSQNSNDFATTVDVLIEVITNYQSLGMDFDFGTCIYACAPFTTVSLLKQSFEYLDNETDCVFPALSYSHPIQRAFSVTKEGKIIPFFEENTNNRTQDLKPTFFDAGMFYSFSTTNFLKNKSLRTENTKSIVLDEMLAHDIDNEDDWRLAEFKYKMYFNA